MDDDIRLATIYERALSDAGLEVKTVMDVDSLFETAKQFTPDLILLDIILPVKDGLAALREIKENPQLKHIPVVIVSNLNQPEDIERAKSLGALDYLVKSSLSLPEFVNKIRSY